MVHNERRLKQMLLYKLLKEEIQDITFFMSLFKLNMMLFCKFSCLLQSLNFIPVNACVLLHCVNHCDTLERLTEIHRDSFVYDLCRSEHFLCDKTIQVLCQIHHAVVICKCLVKLHQSELRVMSCIKTLITEYTSDLIYLLESSDNQSLQVQLQGNTKLQIFVQGIEMCLERSCCCSTCVLYKHWSLNFHKSFSA